MQDVVRLKLLKVTADHYRPELSAWVFGTHKTKSKTGIKHVVLTTFMREMTESLIAKYPTGPLFRGEKGGAMTARTLHHYLTGLVRRVGICRRIVPYYFRHTYCTTLLESGMSDVKVAALLGHSSTRYVAGNYSHVRARVCRLQGDLDALMGG